MKKNASAIKILGIIVFFLTACTSQKEKEKEKVVEGSAINSGESPQVIHPEFDSILTEADVVGTILIYHEGADTYHANRFSDWKTGSLPASTFKIVNSIIGLETGVISGLEHPFIWDGTPRSMKFWERDFNLDGAYKNSCLPCYQQVADSIGTERMISYLDKLNFGNMIVTDSSLNTFWVSGESAVSPYQQIDFLQRIKNRELPISHRTYEIMNHIMMLDSNDEFMLYGKTGWSIRDGNNTGWFVGWVNRSDEIYFFATRINPNEAFNMDLFARIRKEITDRALRSLWSKNDE